MGSADLQALEAAFGAMAVAQERDDLKAWRDGDRSFHAAHMGHSPLLLRQDLERLADRSALYRSVWAREAPHRDPQTVEDHLVIKEACHRRDATAAAQGIARHQARIAISAMAGAMPEKEPATIRAALQIVLGGIRPSRNGA